MSDTESRVLDTIAAMNLASLEQVTGLDPQTVVLVRFAALVALDAAPLSYLTHLAVGQEAGINGEQVEDVLLALAPLVGSARVVSAGSKIARALGIAVLGAEAADEADDEEPDDRRHAHPGRLGQAHPVMEDLDEAQRQPAAVSFERSWRVCCSAS